MNNEPIQAQYDLTKKSRLKKFYDNNKIIIFSTIFIFIIGIFSYSFYLKTKEDKKKLLSENYIEAIILLESNKKNDARHILKTIVMSNDKIYSSLSLFLLLNENLIEDKNELNNLFNHLLENNNFDKEIENLIIYKRALFQSNFVDESVLLETLKPLINSKTLWKPHALLLLGDYFLYKKEFLKAKEFYSQILALKDFNDNEIQRQAMLQLSLIANE